jgi:hypothetical protein
LVLCSGKDVVTSVVGTGEQGWVLPRLDTVVAPGVPSYSQRVIMKVGGTPEIFFIIVIAIHMQMLELEWTRNSVEKVVGVFHRSSGVYQLGACFSGVYHFSNAGVLDTDICIRILAQSLDTTLEVTTYNKIGMNFQT